MIIKTTKIFDKQYKKRLRKNEQERVNEALKIFMNDKFDTILNNHALHGKYKGKRSMNAGGDIRIIFEEKGGIIIILLAIGTHAQLYK